MTPLLGAAATGFGTTLSLILAIGAQNAFVLRQGLKREHVFVIASICAVSDAILITAGVLGFGAIVELWPAFPTLMRYAGAAFLVGYAILRFYAAVRGSGQLEAAGQVKPLRAAIFTCLALTWLNPHVYLDTLGLLGAISTQFAWGPEKLVFATAAISASFVFFFSLGYGARLLAPLMASPRAWQVLDGLIGILMLWLAFILLNGH